MGKERKATFLLKSIQREPCGTTAQVTGKHALGTDYMPGRQKDEQSLVSVSEKLSVRGHNKKISMLTTKCREGPKNPDTKPQCFPGPGLMKGLRQRCM